VDPLPKDPAHLMQAGEGAVSIRPRSFDQDEARPVEGKPFVDLACKSREALSQREPPWSREDFRLAKPA
jgi:hypothetical protein